MTTARLLFHFNTSQQDLKKKKREMKPVIVGAWQSMSNFRSARGEQFYPIQVCAKWSEYISNPEEIVVELEFQDRGLEFDQDLVRSFGIALLSRWGKSIRFKIKKLPGKSKVDFKEDQTNIGIFDAAS